MTKFDQSYWDKNYSEPEEMDGIANAHSHALYVKSFFDIELVEVKSVIDFGFGLGTMFQEFIKTFKPYKACGIEPSDPAFLKFQKSSKKLFSEKEYKLYNEDLLTWCRLDRKSASRFDLGICNSVFQYISEKDLKEIIPILSQRVKYLYLSVPTDEEYKRQKLDHDFVDEYAIHRTREFYLKLLRPHFAIVGAKILESKHHFDQSNTPMTDFLFRF